MKSEHCSFQSLVPVHDLKRPIDWGRQFGRRAPTDVEIGFGMGEVLRRMARESPKRNFIGIEQHWERICKTLRVMTREQSRDPGVLRNIRILKADARVCFERLIAPESIQTIYCLFPCPWPKKGHVKHRLFDHDFLRLLNSRLKRKGKIRIVTDFYPYHEWVGGQVKGAGFVVKASTIKPQFGTKFERKWRDEGQEEFFELELTKSRHIKAPVKEDVVLKNYTLKHFDFEHFKPNDLKGKISVIFKDVIFDRERKKAMIHSLVAEDHMTQHFWIAITGKNASWRITKAEGQNFFPTPGIAKALELVYEAAKRT